ncbi:MAG: GNAT family N-acetyltransferase [Nibricoccus sp.]
MKALPSDCTVRRLHLSDEPALLEFFHSHSKETIFQRYHYLLAEMTHKQAISLLDVDQEGNVALGIFEEIPDGERILAIARYYTEPTGRVAEMAFVVRESTRRLGLATRLLHELGQIASEHGLTWLRAQVLHDNYAMRGLLNHYAPRVHHMPYSDVVEYFVPVSAFAPCHARH